MAHMKRVDQLLVMGALVEEEVIAIKRKKKLCIRLKETKGLKRPLLSSSKPLLPVEPMGYDL
jgi:hypothetical protein